ncbi:MAG: imidazoleglycerol-phosphate dehydratase HisB [Bradymonadaceae bacterium]
MIERRASIERKTLETEIELELDLDGLGSVDIDTGIGFLNHMLTALTRHGRFDLRLRCQGDLHVDDHHTAEDCGLVLGQAFDEALGERRGIARFGYAYAPLDEALARAVVDFSGRPHAEIHLGLTRDAIGGIACENIKHVFESFAIKARAAVHIDVLRGENDHHRAEAAFKALALALRQAVHREGDNEVPSTKGVL